MLTAEELAELNSISGNDEEIEYRFAKDLDFGTAGMRGIIGMGTNMMNVYTVKRATQGLAEYIKSIGGRAKSRGVAISFLRYSPHVGVVRQNGSRRSRR